MFARTTSRVWSVLRDLTSWSVLHRRKYYCLELVCLLFLLLQLVLNSTDRSGSPRKRPNRRWERSDARCSSHIMLVLQSSPRAPGVIQNPKIIYSHEDPEMQSFLSRDFCPRVGATNPISQARTVGWICSIFGRRSRYDTFIRDWTAVSGIR